MKDGLFRNEDFDQMNWHDCKIYAFGFDDTKFQFFLDIDYIFSWIAPTTESGSYEFTVSPALLKFENVHTLQIDIRSDLNLEIDEIVRFNPKRPVNADHIGKEIEYEWIIRLQQGEISFNSVGFEQLIRKEPILLDRQL